MELELKKASEIREKYLTTGCPILDKTLRGGIPGVGLTEFVGSSGNGKTQMCLQLALTVQLPSDSGGLGSGAVYINTESSFPSKRLAQLAQHFKERFGNKFPDDPMSNVFIEHAADSEALKNCIQTRLPLILNEQRSKRIGLIILDSIAAIFRSEYDNFAERAVDLKLVGKVLHDIAYTHQVIMVVVNQVTGSMTGGDIPSLGMTWKNFVTTQIQFLRKDEKRSWSIPFSSTVPITNVSIKLDEGGIQGLPTMSQ